MSSGTVMVLEMLGERTYAILGVQCLGMRLQRRCRFIPSY